ncbi:MAG: hypothetical protein GY801_00775 [bacterium]|nr:hypothetical protein [bacterium]
MPGIIESKFKKEMVVNGAVLKTMALQKEKNKERTKGWISVKLGENYTAVMNAIRAKSYA